MAIAEHLKNSPDLINFSLQGSRVYYLILLEGAKDHFSQESVKNKRRALLKDLLLHTGKNHPFVQSSERFPRAYSQYGEYIEDMIDALSSDQLVQVIEYTREKIREEHPVFLGPYLAVIDAIHQGLWTDDIDDIDLHLVDHYEAPIVLADLYEEKDTSSWPQWILENAPSHEEYPTSEEQYWEWQDIVEGFHDCGFYSPIERDGWVFIFIHPEHLPERQA